MDNEQRLESLGPAERIIQTLTKHESHLYHNRPGYVVNEPSSAIGKQWFPVTHTVGEDGTKTVFRKEKIGKKERKIPLGVLGDDSIIRDGRTVVGEYRPAGIFPEVAEYMYRQVAEVWKADHEFAARWASYAYHQDHRDLKVILAAFMLVQSRHGEAVRENGDILFYDEDYREVGEAMCLIRSKDGKDLGPKQFLRVFEVLSLPSIAAINRELGFTRSSKNPFLGRLTKVGEKWLAYREKNLPMLQGLVQAGLTKTVRKIAQNVGYKPTSPEFFKILRWKQKQAKEGHRTIAIGEEVAKADTWEGLSEEEICVRIVQGKPSFKKIVGMLPKEVGLTRAIMAATIQAGCVSDADLLILTPTLEELGLLNYAPVKSRWEKATQQATDQRAANIAQRVKRKETREKLETAADTALQKAVEESTRGLKIYVAVDKSASMSAALDVAKRYLAKFVQAIPLERLHVCTFNTVAKEIRLPVDKKATASAKGGGSYSSSIGVQRAFSGESAGGGTVYASSLRVFVQHPPKEDEDVLMIFIGDQADSGHQNFAPSVQQSNLRPSAFGLLEVVGKYGQGVAVERTAQLLGIPCFRLEEKMFQDDDPYAIPRVLRHLIESTPVGVTSSGTMRSSRVSLAETILNTELLHKPTWA